MRAFLVIEKIMDEMTRQGIDRVEICRKSGLSYNTISELFRNPKKPIRVTTAKKILKVFKGVSFSDFFLTKNYNVL